MKFGQFHVLAGLSGLCLASAYGLMLLGKSVMQVQSDLNAQQETINRMERIREPATAFMLEVGEVSTTNAVIEALLARNGYTVRIGPNDPRYSAVTNQAATPAPK